MIPATIPSEVLGHLQRELGRPGRPLSRAACYARIAAKVADYGKTITNAEAAFILASQNGIDVRAHLDQDGRDRVLALMRDAPLRPVEGRPRTVRDAVPAAKEPKAPLCRARPVDAFDCVGLHAQVVATCRSLFRQGHRARAVEEAAKLFNNTVKERLGRPIKSNGKEYDGSDLMDYAFSGAAGTPRLRINEHRTESQKNEQNGYYFMAKGAILGLRNPRAHDHLIQDEPDRALEMIGLLSYLIKKLDGAVRTRQPKKP